MDLMNQTPLAAGFVNTIVGEGILLGAVIAKGVFRIEPGGLALDAERQWPVGGQPVPTPFGELDGDAPFLKEAVDLIVLGNAHAPEGKPVTSMLVCVHAGETKYEVRVSGDRTWLRRAGRLIPSAPASFTSMPLTWDRAFGGKAKLLPGPQTSPIELEVPFAANPEGRGYCMDERVAEGLALPNLEDPEQPIRAWNDWPEPRGVGPYKREWSLRALRAVDLDLSVTPPRLVRIKPAYYNNASPRLVLPLASVLAAPVRITGVMAGGRELAFSLPDRALHAYVQLADRAYVFPAHLDTILVLTEEQRVVLGYRCVFRYRMVPLERRAAVLREGHAPAQPPPDYRIDWAELDAAERARG